VSCGGKRGWERVDLIAIKATRIKANHVPVVGECKGLDTRADGVNEVDVVNTDVVGVDAQSTR
jgi:hypothetical protein